ncbi:MAG: actin, cytoplasmic 2 [Candidatus Hermodarchaeota archaeon]
MLRPVVLDNGTRISKNGFAGEDEPRSAFPTLIGYPKYPTIVMHTYYSSRLIVGDEALALYDVLNLLYPMVRGTINNWEAMEKIWHYSLYSDLRIDPSEHPVLLTDRLSNTDQNRVKTAEILFESFNIPALHIANSSRLSLGATGLTTGLVVDIGAGGTDIVPIWENYVIWNSSRYFNIGGEDITYQLKELISQNKVQFLEWLDLELIRDIKERLCYVALEPTETIFSQEHIEKEYVLPDGEILTIGLERFQAPEILFNPPSSFKENSLATKINEAILACDAEYDTLFYENIVLTGGSTLLPGLEERLQKELTELVPGHITVRVRTFPHRMYSTWMGGAFLSSLASFEKFFFTKNDYQNSGPFGINNLRA